MCSVHFTVFRRVFKLQVSLLHEGGDLLEFIVSISGVVHDDSVEHFGKMSIEVLLDVTTGSLGFTELGLDAFKGFTVNTHNYFV